MKVKRSLRLKMLGAFMATAMAAAGMVMSSAPAAQAAVTSGCRTIIRVIPFQEGSVSWNVGQQRLTLNVCWNKRGTITQSSLTQQVSATGKGIAAGYSFQDFTTYTPNGSSSGANTVRWIAPARGRGCIAVKTPLCGFAEDFQTTVAFYSPAFIGPLPANQQGATFRTVCTNSTCKFRFKNQT